MDSETYCQRLRVYTTEQEKYHHQPLYEAILEQAQRAGLRGATVTRGVLGFGTKSHMHSTKFLALSENLPIIIEVVESHAHLAEFVAQVRGMAPEVLMTLEPVCLVKKGPVAEAESV